MTDYAAEREALYPRIAEKLNQWRAGLPREPLTEPEREALKALIHEAELALYFDTWGEYVPNEYLDPNELRMDGGSFGIKYPERGRDRAGGIGAHRGTLHPDEYIDVEAARREFDRLAPFTVAEAQEIYTRGRIPESLRERRRELDQALLELDGSMPIIALVLGISDATILRARNRARAEISSHANCRYELDDI